MKPYSRIFLNLKYRTRLEKLAKDKHSSLLFANIVDEEKRFITTTPVRQKGADQPVWKTIEQNLFGDCT
jgi:hypothetical protein